MKFNNKQIFFSKKRYIKILQAILFFIIVISVLSFIYNKNLKQKKRNTYCRSLSKDAFFKKLKTAPTWMDEQIKNDFKDFTNRTVSQDSLEETFLTIRKRLPIQGHRYSFVRFRVINNKVYRYFPKEDNFYPKEVFYVKFFENALRTLTLITKLPDIDLIFSSRDGTPLIEDSKDFYLVEKSSKQAPLFSWAKLSSAKFVIMVPDYSVLTNDWPVLSQDVLTKTNKSTWDSKANVLFWRGQSSKGIRQKICEFSLKYPDLIDAGFGRKDFENNFIKTLCKNKKERETFFSLYKGFTSLDDQLNYKYLAVLDGIMCTYPGYQWRLFSNCVIFKQQSNEIQWFYNALKPYEHYIPINKDLSDLQDKIIWAQQNDEACRKIAQNATDFALNNLAMEDIYVYLYKVLETYSKYQNYNKKDLRKDVKLNSRWVCVQNRDRANKILRKQTK